MFEAVWRLEGTCLWCLFNPTSLFGCFLCFWVFSFQSLCLFMTDSILLVSTLAVLYYVMQWQKYKSRITTVFGIWRLSATRQGAYFDTRQGSDWTSIAKTIVGFQCQIAFNATQGSSLACDPHDHHIHLKIIHQTRKTFFGLDQILNICDVCRPPALRSTNTVLFRHSDMFWTSADVQRRRKNFPEHLLLFNSYWCVNNSIIVVCIEKDMNKTYHARSERCKHNFNLCLADFKNLGSADFNK